MSPKIKVVLAVPGCIAASIAIAWLAMTVGERLGLISFYSSSHYAITAKGDYFIFLSLLSSIVTFIGGALLLRRTFRAATKTSERAKALTIVFATFPIWFVIGCSFLFSMFFTMFR